MKLSNYILIGLITFSLMILCVGCPESIDDPDSEIVITNNSNVDIIFFHQYNSIGDTSLSTFSFPLTQENTLERTIKTHNSYTLPGSFRTVLKKYPSKVLMLYLFSRDTIEHVSWERIVDEYLVLRRYDLTLDSLEKLNWTIAYP